MLLRAFEDLAWLPRDRRFAMALKRFDWDAVAHNPANKERRRAVLRFEHVLSAKIQGLDLRAGDMVVSLLAIDFEETDPPGGVINLVFAGDGAIRLTVECIEGELRDLGASWKTKSTPHHAIVDGSDRSDGETET